MDAHRCWHCLALLLLTACASPATTDQDPSAPVFATQAGTSGAREVMEALYEGPVVEARGCFRLGSDSAHTVIWPPAFTLRTQSGEARVVNERGAVVGVIGGVFRFGGGEIPRGTLPALADAALGRELLTRCPGRYWVVGEMLPPSR